MAKRRQFSFLLILSFYLFCLLYNSLNFDINNYVPLTICSCVYISRQHILCFLYWVSCMQQIYEFGSQGNWATNLKNWKLQVRWKMLGEEQPPHSTERANPHWLSLDLLSGSVLANRFKSQNIHWGDCLGKKVLKESEFNGIEIILWTLDTCWEVLQSQGTETILLDLCEQLWWSNTPQVSKIKSFQQTHLKEFPDQ